jgi:hypothetical protein
LQRAPRGHIGDNFLESFKARGWYLDDLELEPVDALDRPEHKARCRDVQASLADRIRDYQLLAIVSLLLGIRRIVDAAAIAAGNNAPRYAVPFPGNRQQVRFLKEMARILPMLPRQNVVPGQNGA